MTHKPRFSAPQILWQLLCVMSLAFTVSAYAQTPISISMSLALTGKYAEAGNEQMKGVKLWESDVNRRGGILGRQVRLTIADDQSDPKIAVERYQQFVVDEKVDLVFAPYTSVITNAVAPITEKFKYPMIAQGASATSLWEHGYRYLFGVASPSTNFSSGFLELLVANKMDRVGLIAADDVLSKDNCNAAVVWAKRYDLNIVFNGSYSSDISALEKIVEKIKNANAQAVLVCGLFEEATNVRLAMKKIGWFPRGYFAPAGPTLPKYSEALGQSAEGTFTLVEWSTESPFPGAREFSEAYNKAYGKSPSWFAAEAFAGGQILEAAAKNANTINREKLRDALASLNTSTIFGLYGVDHTGKQVRNVLFVGQLQNGKVQTVWPAEWATAKPVWNQR